MVGRLHEGSKYRIVEHGPPRPKILRLTPDDRITGINPRGCRWRRRPYIVRADHHTPTQPQRYGDKNNKKKNSTLAFTPIPHPHVSVPHTLLRVALGERSEGPVFPV